MIIFLQSASNHELFASFSSYSRNLWIFFPLAEPGLLFANDLPQILFSRTKSTALLTRTQNSKRLHRRPRTLESPPKNINRTGIFQTIDIAEKRENFAIESKGKPIRYVANYKDKSPAEVDKVLPSGGTKRTGRSNRALARRGIIPAIPRMGSSLYAAAWYED